MVEELKELIEKIQQEGIKAAEDKARDIEAEAQNKAQAIIRKAEQEAKMLIAEAREKNARAEQSIRVSLKQAGRDMLLSLKKEINSMLDKLIRLRVREALTPKDLAHIIITFIKDCSHKNKENIVISLKKQDLEELEKSFLSELQEAVKKGIVLKPSEDMLGGFIISYDGGKSHFDFTDKALAEYISSCLKPKLAQILQSE